ncbi:MAG: YbbC/YhhH family protein [Mucilaginibacter sp.]
MRQFLFLLLFFPLISAAQNQQSSDEIKREKEIIKSALADTTGKQILVDKVIPDKQTAIAVAEPILFKIYGKNHILGEKPYNVSFLDGYWLLSGSLPERKGYIVVGGTFFIILSEKDGRVIKLTHGK